MGVCQYPQHITVHWQPTKWTATRSQPATLNLEAFNCVSWIITSAGKDVQCGRVILLDGRGLPTWGWCSFRFPFKSPKRAPSLPCYQTLSKINTWVCLYIDIYIYIFRDPPKLSFPFWFPRPQRLKPTLRGSTPEPLLQLVCSRLPRSRLHLGYSKAS